MKITSKTLMVGFQTEVKLGNNDAIELTLIHQAYISRDQLGKLIVDMDLGIDIDNVKFLGIDIDADYTSFKQFKAQLLELGIDLNKLIVEKEAELITNGIENELKLLFRNNEL
jgi:hypothetical protein